MRGRLSRIAAAFGSFVPNLPLLLSVKRPSLQTPPDDGFLSLDGGLDPSALTVAGGSLPFHSPASADRDNMQISLAVRT
jgi:hypothetical protein